MEIISCTLDPIQRVFGSDIPVVVTVVAQKDPKTTITACGFTVISTLDTDTLSEAFLRAKKMAIESLQEQDSSSSLVVKTILQPKVECLKQTKKTEWSNQGRDEDYITKALAAPVDETRIKQISDLCESLGLPSIDLANYSLVEAMCLKASLEEAAKVLE